MKFKIEKKIDDYNPDFLLPIWREGLPDLDERRLNWSYKHNPISPPIVGLLKRAHDNHVFGCETIFPREFCLGGEVIAGGKRGDFAIKKKFRGLGPALELQKYMLELVNNRGLLVAFPNKIAEKVQIRAGFQKIGGIKLYIKPLKGAYLLKKIKNGHFFLFLAPLVDLILRCRDLGNKTYSDTYTAEEVSEIDHKFDQLWEEAKGQFSFVGKRDAEYLQWRYLENPYKKFYFFVIKEKRTNKICGYLVYEIRDNIVFISDLFWNGQQEVFISLFCHFTKTCNRSGLQAIYFNLFENIKIDGLLKKNRFIRKDTITTVLVSKKKLLEPYADNILLTKGDDDF